MTRVLEDLVDLFKSLEIDYMIVGSFASSLYGQLSSTQDLDVVVDLDFEKLQRLRDQLPEERYHLPFETACESLRRRGQFNIIDFANGGKIDVLVLKQRAFSQSEFARRRVARYGGREMSFASPEDVILAKLEWNAIAPPERQLRDVAGVLSLQAGRLDWAYLDEWAEVLGVRESLTQLRASQ